MVNVINRAVKAVRLEKELKRMFSKLGVVWLSVFMSLTFTAQAEDSIPRDASKIIGEVCVSCHGQDGNAMVMGAPKLGGQKADYLTKALMDYKTGIRNNAVMSAFSSTLSSAEMIAIGKYFESQASTLTVPK